MIPHILGKNKQNWFKWLKIHLKLYLKIDRVAVVWVDLVGSLRNRVEGNLGLDKNRFYLVL